MQPLAPAPGRNDLVEACRAMVEKSAEAHGAARVEAVGAGPHRRVRAGDVAPVQFRILYPGFLRSQVCQARLTCKADREDAGRRTGWIGPDSLCIRHSGHLRRLEVLRYLRPIRRL